MREIYLQVRKSLKVPAHVALAYAKHRAQSGKEVYQERC